MSKSTTTNAGPHERLRKIIEDRIEEQPHECEGYAWAAESQEWWRDQGFPPATLRRLIAKPPVVRKRRHVNGKVTTLLRVGTPGPKTPRDYFNILVSIWRKRVLKPQETEDTGLMLSNKEVGCIWGLIDEWPEGQAPQLLHMVLDDWPLFMTGAKTQMTEESLRFYKFPSLPVIRRFASVAPEMLMIQKQSKLGAKSGVATQSELNATLKLLQK